MSEPGAGADGTTGATVMSASGRSAKVSSALAKWRRELSAVGGVNPLLWQTDSASGTLTLTTAHPSGVAKLLAGNPVLLSELVRSADAYAAAADAAREVAAKATELEQERGLSACHIAIGTATWAPSEHYPATPAAPILLWRARIQPVSQGGDLRIELVQHPFANPVLLAFLASRGITVEAERLVGSATSAHGLSPDGAYALLREACRGLSGFAISPSLDLSTYTLAKSAMVEDLAQHQDDLQMHDVLAALAGEDEAIAQVSLPAPEAPADADLENELLVLDADSGQQRVIDAVTAGANLVVLGPPGTGKSQTIANLVATLTSHGRRVLVVAEKRAAVDAVLGRLRSRGLGELVLDGHGDLDERYALAGAVAGIDAATASTHWSQPPVDGELQRLRQELADHHEAMHAEEEPWGVSIDEAQSRVGALVAIPDPPHSRVRLLGTRLRDVSDERRSTAREALIDLAQAGSWVTDQSADPWFGARIVGAEQTERARALVTRWAETDLVSYRGLLADLADRVGLHAPASTIEAEDQLDLMARVFATLEIFRPEIFDAPLDQLVQATAGRGQRTTEMTMMDRRRLRQQAKRLLRPGPPPSDLNGVLELAAAQKKQWRERSGPGSRPAAPVDVPDVYRAHQKYREELEWLGARLEPTADGGDLVRTDFEALGARLKVLHERLDRLQIRSETVTRADELTRMNLGPLVEDLAARRVPADRVGIEFDFVWWSSVLQELRGRRQAYSAHSGEDLRADELRYRAADAEHIDAGVARVRAAYAERVRRAATDFPDQVASLRQVLEDGSAVHLRELLPTHAEVLTSVRPCWAMSPLTVPLTVPPGLWFDVVIFDEASQVLTAQAVPAISRAEQVVVVGDPRQLPPTPFRVAGAADDVPEAPPGESVLDALGRILPQESLHWHYRSLDERLVAFANAQIYRGGLVTFPGVSAEPVVTLDVVADAAGDGETSVAEVAKVVEVVRECVAQRPQESVGVIAIGRRHAEQVRAALRAAATDDEALSAALAGTHTDALFVKALDHVQGDERDTVVLTLGYGRGARGEVVHRFGALGSDSGERRLNVATTRARQRMRVVSAVTAHDLAPEKLRSRGSQLLRDFLLFAEESAVPAVGASEPEPTPAPKRVAKVGGRRRRTAAAGSVVDRPMQALREQRPVPPVVSDLAQRLRKKGMTVHTAYGVSGQPIDLVVEDPQQPGVPILAVETDGPIWASMAGVRDRDRLRAEQLERLGWAVERVWSVDVFRDPARDSARIVNTVRQLSEEAAEQRRARRSREQG
ncbi:AAA domain-containing protein [Dermacoccaceae bacterium W4C1]